MTLDITLRSSFRFSYVEEHFQQMHSCKQCSGPSMEPTIYSNNILVTEHISPRLQKIKRGDIIIAQSPTDPLIHVCKRVVALPGDEVLQGVSHTVIPRGHVWLQGDNLQNSTDSRSYGPVPQGLIRGRAIFKVWPLKDIQMLTQSKEWGIVK